MNTFVILKKVTSTHNEIIDQVELEYATFQDFGEDMLDYRRNNVYRLDSMFSYKSVYFMGNTTHYTPLFNITNASNHQFNNWNRYLHARHQDFMNPTGRTNVWMNNSRNPYIGDCQPCQSNEISPEGYYFRKPKIGRAHV